MPIALIRPIVSGVRDPLPEPVIAGVGSNPIPAPIRIRSIAANALDCRSSLHRFESGRIRQFSKDEAMQWLIENASVPESALDQSSTQLLEVIKQKGLPWVGTGIIPFSHEITGLTGADPDAPSMFFGSTLTASILAKMDTFRPAVYWKDEWWDPRTWIGRRSDLLNSQIRTITAAELRDRWITEPTFCKSAAVKHMTGNVLEVDKKDRDDWTIEFSNLDGDSELLLSPPIRLQAEWRFFVVGGKVVTGSLYRKEGIKRRMLPVEPEVWAAADRAVQKWMPHPTIVLDLALTEYGDYEVVEFNAINCSGWYNSDISRVVDALEAINGATV